MTAKGWRWWRLREMAPIPSCLATWIGRPGIVAAPAADLALPIDQIAAVQVISADTGDVLSQYNP